MKDTAPKARTGRKKGSRTTVSVKIRHAIAEAMEAVRPDIGEWLREVAAQNPAEALRYAIELARIGYGRYAWRPGTELDQLAQAHGLASASHSARAREENA